MLLLFCKTLLLGLYKKCYINPIQQKKEFRGQLKLDLKSFAELSYWLWLPPCGKILNRTDFVYKMYFISLSEQNPLPHLNRIPILLHSIIQCSNNSEKESKAGNTLVFDCKWILATSINQNPKISEHMGNIIVKAVVTLHVQ